MEIVKRETTQITEHVGLMVAQLNPNRKDLINYVNGKNQHRR